MALKRGMRRTGAEQRAVEAGRGLLAFLEGLQPGVELIRSMKDRDDRRVMLGELVTDLAVAATVIETLKRQLKTAETLHRQISGRFADLRRSAGSPISPETGRMIRAEDLPKPTSAARINDEEASERPTFPANLMPEAMELWQLGLSVRAANRLARAGFRTLLELLIFRPVSRLGSFQGLGDAVVGEVSLILRQRGHDPDENVEPAITLEKATPRRPRRKRQDVDWEAIGASVREALETLGGSGTLTEIFQSLGLPASRVKRGLRHLERQGAVRRTGIRRSTRYHLSTESSGRSPWRSNTPAARESLP
jgi:IclR helix-turn-helix domain